MPHIKTEDKAVLADAPASTVGGLTWQLQQVLARYLVNVHDPDHGGLHYHDLAQCIAALEGCKADFIEQVLNPYERDAIERNGNAWAPLKRAEIIA